MLDAPYQVRGSEFIGVARIENLRAGLLQFEQGIDCERVHLARECFVQCRVLLAVQHSVIGKIRGSIRLVSSHYLDEGLFAHWLQRVI